MDEPSRRTDASDPRRSGDPPARPIPHDDPFRLIVEQSVDGALLVDAEGVVLFANPAAAELLGRPIDSLLDHHFGIPLAAGQVAEIDAQGRDGRGRVVELRVVQARQDARAPVLIALLRDVTPHRRLADSQRYLAEAGARLAASLDLEETLERLGRLLIQGFADGGFVDLIQPDGSVRREVARHAKPELDAQLAPMRGRAVVHQGGLAGVLRSGRAACYEHVGPEVLELLGAGEAEHRRLGALGIQSLLIVPLTTRGRTFGALSLITTRPGQRFDSEHLETARELAHLAALHLESGRLYDEARTAVRRRDEFLAMLSHELRNPLGSIVHAVELFKRRPERPEPPFRIVDQQAGQMARLLDDLLEVSRYMRGKVQIRPEPIDLVEVIDHAASAVAPALEARGHRLHRPDLPGPIRLIGDPVRLAQVLANLLTNAVKYTPPGGNIWVEVDLEDEHIQLRVRDDGPGIDAQLLPHLFEPFIQGPSPEKRPSEGLGVGLSLVRIFVELHGGAVHATSDGPGRGSTFHVRLPRAAEAAQSRLVEPNRARDPGQRPPPEPEAPKPIRVLIVEDDEDNRRTLAELLELLGHQVEVAEDAPTALMLMCRSLPDVALVDLGLPGMNGLELAQRIRSDPELADVRLAALSGYARTEDRVRASLAGFDIHFAKPIRVEALETYFAEVTAGRGSPNTPGQTSNNADV